MNKEANGRAPVERRVRQDDVIAALRVLHDTGRTRIRAAELAEILWPGRRNHNSNGQVFTLSAGIAGRMLRKCPAVWEVEIRVWEIIPELLS